MAYDPMKALQKKLAENTRKHSDVRARELEAEVAEQPPATSVIGQRDALTSHDSSLIEDNVSLIPVALLDRSPFQPRIQIDEEGVRNLADAISAEGLYNPITVRKKHDGRYELVGGERRWLAHQLLGASEIRAYVVEIDDAAASIRAVADNTAREGVADYELGNSFKKLLDAGTVKNVSSLARLMGMSRSQVDRCLDYMKLPDEVLRILDMNPKLFGANTAEVMAGYIEAGYRDLVLHAVGLIHDKGMDERYAITWLKGEATRVSQKKPPRMVTPLSIGGKFAGEAYVEHSKVVITCSRGTKPADLLNSIAELLAGMQSGAAD